MLSVKKIISSLIVSPLIIIPSIALANSAVPRLSTVPTLIGAPQPPLIPTLIIALLVLFCVIYLANILAIFIGSLILKQHKLVTSLKFLKYSLLATTGAIVIDLLLAYICSYLVAKINIHNNLYTIDIAIILTTFLCLTIHNYWLSRKFFNLNKIQAFIIGSTIGVLTNFGLLVNIIGFIYSFFEHLFFPYYHF